MVSTDEETGQTIIAGMGELHLEIIQSRLEAEYSVQAPTRESLRLLTARRSLRVLPANTSW